MSRPARWCSSSARRRTLRSSLLAAAGVLAGNQLARWFGVAVLGINAIAMMFFLPAYPFWALVILAAEVVALWGLCAYGSRANIEAT
ncbi:MAG TPA: hypothetical protein VLW50_33680 [Streptosporangiaceae bacterium]|nr:hypothetical protein [Streptosporangiaceae bacterium]